MHEHIRSLKEKKRLD